MAEIGYYYYIVIDSSRIESQPVARQADVRQRVANLLSNVLSPFWVSLLIIVLLAFNSTSSPFDALKWVFIAVLLSVLPIFLVIFYLVRSGRLDAVFTNVREQRTKIYLLAGLCAIVGYIILRYLGAPKMLVATFTAGLLTTLVFMCINLWWKISLHTALVAGAVTLLVMLYGWIAMVPVVLVPLIGWARIELEYHSLAQVATGALLEALIVIVVFAVFYPSLLA